MKTLPKLEDLSPALRDEVAKQDQLEQRAAKVHAAYRTAFIQKSNGDIAQNSGSLVESVLAGDELPTVTDLDAELKRLNAESSAIDGAREIQARRVRQLRFDAAEKLRSSLKPKYDELAKRLCDSLIQTHAAYLEMFSLKRALINDGIGPGGMFAIDADEFLEIPTDRTSRLADFLRAAKAAGYVKNVPAELR